MNHASTAPELSRPSRVRTTAGSRGAHLPPRTLNEAARWPIIGFLITAAVAHAPVTAEHLEEAPYMGKLFVAFTVVALLVAGAIAARPTPLNYVAAAALCASAVLAYAATRVIAFPMLAEDVGAWGEPLGVLSVITEAAVVVLAGQRALALSQRRAVR